ncbi:MAG: hypothetical protein WDN75_18335 [Bacteroidota bacterium]
MPIKKKLKKEEDGLNENLVEETYTLLKPTIPQKRPAHESKSWIKWRKNLGEFTPDFMENRESHFDKVRELL